MMPGSGATLKADVAVLKADVAALRSDVTEMKGTLRRSWRACPPDRVLAATLDVQAAMLAYCRQVATSVADKGAFAVVLAESQAAGTARPEPEILA
jgi:hypothetical protein